MKKLSVMLLSCCALAQVLAAEPDWSTDLPKALAKAKAENKMVLMDFTGSDWCGWCIKFKKEALDTAEFSYYAVKNLVLVEVDFPNKKPQTEALKKANKELGTRYKVEGYPTFVVLGKDGKELGRQDGYEAGGAKAFIAKLDDFKKKN